MAKCVRNGNIHFPHQKVVQGCHFLGLKSAIHENDFEFISLRENNSTYSDTSGKVLNLTVMIEE